MLPRNDPHDPDVPNNQLYRHYNHYANHRPPRRSDEGIEAKLVVMGNTGVGKTSLVRRYTENKFSTSSTATTGAFFVTHKTDFNGFRVKLQIWDTAGQERFRSMAPMYYRGANAAIVMYDVTRLESFNDVQIWLEELKKNCNPDLSIYIVGSKADLVHHRQVTPDRARSKLHLWFPPPALHPPLALQAGPTPNALSAYIRPRFTSLTSAYTGVSATSGSSSGSAAVTKAALTRSNTTAGLQNQSQRPPDTTNVSSFGSAEALPSTNQTRPTSARTHQRERSWMGGGLTFPNILGSSKVDWPEDRQDEPEEQEWGLGKHMQLFEVSAKDSSGVQILFDTIMISIIEKREAIEAERRERERDSVMLHAPEWGPLPEEEEIKAREKSKQGWCC